ncbi:MAG TPA: CBS domain-containing protein, partial [Sedimentisphaerales bacterium]|nr:CBS domain-containing protein [Sedimentisphaerales bacterium]
MAEAQQGQKIGAITPDKNALPATNCFAGDHAAAVDIASGRLVTSSRVWMEVRDIMSTDVTTISSHNTVLSAAKVMSENKISCLVVVDDNNVTGILTETDMLTPIAAQKTDFSTILVADIMSSPVQTVQDELSVFEAGRIMEAESIKKLP